MKTPAVGYITTVASSSSSSGGSPGYDAAIFDVPGNVAPHVDSIIGGWRAAARGRILGMLITQLVAPTSTDTTVDIVDSSDVEQSKIGTLAAGVKRQYTAFGTPLDFDAGTVWAIKPLTGSNGDTLKVQLVVKYATGTPAEGSTYETVANSTGNTTLSTDAATSLKKVRATITGSAGTRIFILDTANWEAGDRIEINFVLPDTASIVLEIRNATSGGTLIYSFTTLGSDATDETRAVAIVEFDGSAWRQHEFRYPVR